MPILIQGSRDTSVKMADDPFQTCLTRLRFLSSISPILHGMTCDVRDDVSTACMPGCSPQIPYFVDTQVPGNLLVPKQG